MAIAPVVISFLAQGMPQVQQAFQSIHAAAIKAERAQQNEAAKTTKAIKKETDDRVKMQIAAMKKADAWQRQAWTAGAREAARVERAKLKSLKDRVSASKQAEKELNTWQQSALKEREQGAARAEANRLKAIKDRIASTKQAEKDLDTWQRKAQKERARETRVASAAQREQDRNRKEIGRVVAPIAGHAGRGLVSGLQRTGNVAMGLANTTAQLGGGFSIADVVERQIGAVKAAANIAHSTMGQNVSTQEILGAAKPVAARFGMETEDAVAGVGGFRKLTGDTKRGMRLLPKLAELATAFDVNMDDLAENAGNIAMKGGDKMDDDSLLKLLRVQTYQGAVGAVEMSEFARYGSRVAGAANLYGGDKAENMAATSAAAQIARQYGTATTGAEASMSSLRFTTDLSKKADSLKDNFDIDVRDGKGTLKSMHSIVSEMMHATKGDVTKITKLGIGDRGDKFLAGAAELYRTKGQEGFDKVWSDLTGVKTDEKGNKVSVLSDQEVANRANARMQEPDKKLAKAFAELRQKAGEELLPVFIDMIDPLKQLVPALVDIAKIGIPAFTDLMHSTAKFAKEYDWLIKDIAAHPIGSILALEISKAALPAILQAGIRAAFEKAAFGEVFKGVFSSQLGQAGLVVASAAIAIQQGMIAIDNEFKKETDVQKKIFADTADIQNLQGKIKSGKGTAEDKVNLQKKIGELQQDAAQLQNIHDNPGFWKKFSGGAASLTKEGQEATVTEESNFQTAMKELAATVREANKALKETPDAAKAGKNNSGANGAGKSTTIMAR